MTLLEGTNWILGKLRTNIKDPLTNTVSGRTWIVHKHALNQSPEYPKIGIEMVSAVRDVPYIDYGRVSATEYSAYYNLVVQLNIEVGAGTSAKLEYNSRNYTDSAKPSNGKLKNMLTDNVIELLETLRCEALNSNEDICYMGDIDITDRDEVDMELIEGKTTLKGIFINIIRFRLRIESRYT